MYLLVVPHASDRPSLAQPTAHNPLLDAANFCFTRQSEVFHTYVSFQSPPYDSTPALKDFAAKYKAAWKDDPGPYSSYGYNEAKIILEAMARAKPLNRDTIVTELHKTNMKGLNGVIEFTDKGELKQPAVYLYKVTNGDFALAYSPGS